MVILVSVCIYPRQAVYRSNKDCECPAVPQFCSLKWGAVGWVKWEQLFQPLMTLMFLISVSNVTHIMWLLCSYLVSVKPWGTGYGNWSVLLACCSCCAGVKLMFICSLVLCYMYIEGPKLAFCSCYPPDTFTRPRKIPTVMLPILLFRGVRYGSLCASTSLLLSRLHIWAWLLLPLQLFCRILIFILLGPWS